MLFTRPATEEDFREYSKEGKDSYLTEDHKQLIEEDKIHIAMKQLREKTGISMLECRTLCQKYRKFYEAKRDFENGKPVFVTY